MAEVTTELRPRRAVIDQAWLDAGLDCPLLSGPDGRPLARTVKCLLDPLVIRPKLNPDLARPLLDADAAARLTELVRQSRDGLRGADRWYALLRAARRSRGITSGNPQELYFPRAWELSFQYGDPADGEATEQAIAATLGEVHPHGDEGPGAVTAELVRPEVAAAARAAWQAAWQSPLPGGIADDLAVAAEGARDVLDGGPISDDAAATRLGQWLRHEPGVIDRLLAAVLTDPQRVRLSDHDPAVPPPLVSTGRAGVLPLDRSLQDRVQATRRRQRARGEEIELSDTIADEIGRAAEPWGLSDPAAHRWLVSGLVVASAIDPLSPVDRAASAWPALVHELAARLAKEAYVLHLRRLLHGGQTVDPAQQSVADDLGAFWRPYLTRLWVRLHGLDSGAEVPAHAGEGRDLLTGVARSVSLDLRTRIRTALERTS